jgi:hypothetical protein
MHVTVLAQDPSRYQPTPAELLRDGKYLQSDRRYRQIGVQLEKMSGFGKEFADLTPAKQLKFDNVRIVIEGRCTTLRLGLQIPTVPQSAGSVP